MLLGVTNLECSFRYRLPSHRDRAVKVTEPLHPSPGGLHGIGIEFAPFYAAAAFLLDQPGVGEHS